jgi:FkbM family methyltransferase
MNAKEKIKRLASRWIQDHRRGWTQRNLAKLARFYNNAWEYPSFEIDENGEARLLKSLSSESIKIVYDVGANVGDWSLEAARLLRPETIHSFEPVPDTYSALSSAAKGRAAITPHPFGLSDNSGSFEFTYYGPDNSFLSTMSNAVHDHLPSSLISIQLRKGAEVAGELATPRIDFLKIDVEGMEFEVLSGFKEMLGRQAIGIIQFEKQPGRRLLKDYYGLLGGYGYKIGKIYSKYVDFRPYDSGQERTAGPNYIAIPAGKEELMGRLQRGFEP